MSIQNQRFVIVGKAPVYSILGVGNGSSKRIILTTVLHSFHFVRDFNLERFNVNTRRNDSSATLKHFNRWHMLSSFALDSRGFTYHRYPTWSIEHFRLRWNYRNVELLVQRFISSFVLLGIPIHMPSSTRYLRYLKPSWDSKYDGFPNGCTRIYYTRPFNSPFLLRRFRASSLFGHFITGTLCNGTHAPRLADDLNFELRFAWLSHRERSFLISLLPPAWILICYIIAARRLSYVLCTNFMSCWSCAKRL